MYGILDWEKYFTILLYLLLTLYWHIDSLEIRCALPDSYIEKKSKYTNLFIDAVQIRVRASPNGKGGLGNFLQESILQAISVWLQPTFNSFLPLSPTIVISQKKQLSINSFRNISLAFTNI